MPPQGAPSLLPTPAARLIVTSEVFETQDAPAGLHSSRKLAEESHQSSAELLPAESRLEVSRRACIIHLRVCFQIFLWHVLRQQRRGCAQLHAHARGRTHAVASHVCCHASSCTCTSRSCACARSWRAFSLTQTRTSETETGAHENVHARETWRITHPSTAPVAASPPAPPPLKQSKPTE